MRSAVTKGGGLALLRRALVNNAGARLGRKASKRRSTWMPVGPAVSCCRLTSRSTAQIPPFEQFFSKAPPPWDMAWQCGIAGCSTHCTAHTEDAACETSSASSTATIVADGKGSLTTGSAYAVCRHFWLNRLSLCGQANRQHEPGSRGHLVKQHPLRQRNSRQQKAGKLLPTGDDKGAAAHVGSSLPLLSRTKKT
jgi:hypothetical protein